MNALRRILAILRKEMRHITRDTRVMFLVTLAPALLLLLLSYVFSFDVDRFTLAVLDLDHSATSRDYLSAVTSDGEFEITRFVSSYGEIDALLAQGTVDMALVIPRGFGSAALGGRGASAQAVVDGVNALSAGQGIAQLTARTTVFGSNLSAELRAGKARPANAGAVRVTRRAWYNTALKSLHSMAPGLLAVVLFMPAMAVTLALAREKETGSFEGLIATPVRGVEYLAGKLLAYLVMGLIGAGAAVLVAVAWFGVPLRGSLLALLGLTALYFLATMGIGLLVAHFVSSQQTAMTIILLAFFVPSFFISGLITPIDATTPSGVLTAYSLPTTHFITITRSVFLKGAGLESLWPQAALLTGMAAIMIGLSMALFRKKIR